MIFIEISRVTIPPRCFFFSLEKRPLSSRYPRSLITLVDWPTNGRLVLWIGTLDWWVLEVLEWSIAGFVLLFQNITGWWCWWLTKTSEKYEFVNGFRMTSHRWKIKNASNHQPASNPKLPFKSIDLSFEPEKWPYTLPSVNNDQGHFCYIHQWNPNSINPFTLIFNTSSRTPCFTRDLSCWSPHKIADILNIIRMELDKSFAK